MSIANMLGARPIISGLNAGIVSSLVIVNADIDGIEATLHTEDAIALIIKYQEQNTVIELNTDENDREDETQHEDTSDETIID